MTNKHLATTGQLLIYQTEDGRLKVEARLEDETLWLTQQQMAELFQTSRTNVVEHIQHIYDEGELVEAATCREFRQVRTEGAREVARTMAFYNLDMILSVGYRVKSAVATRFRIWATQRLGEYIVKGFVLDDERLKQGKRVFGKDFFATVQNKLRWAITGQTAAELIYSSADSAYLDLAENRAERGIITRMAEWVEFLNRFLDLSNYPILKDKGKISALEAKLKAETEYEVFRQRQDREYISDFDREIKRLEGEK